MRMNIQGSATEVQSVLQKFDKNEHVHLILETNGHKTIDIAEVVELQPNGSKPVNPQKAYWARFTPEQRSKEMKRRLKLGARRK
jgi:hypothetical protein